MNRNYISIVIGALVIASYGFLTYGAGNEREIRVPQQNGTRVVEHLNLEDEEPFTYETFYQLMQKKVAQNLPYIVARVETENHLVRYYDAHELNQYLFANFPTRLFHDIKAYRDLMTTMPIARIDYFITDSNQEFQYFCSFNDLVADIVHWRNLFYTNQLPKPKQLVEHAYNILLAAEYADREPTQDEYTKARHWLELAANQETDLSAAAEANARLAGLYRDGSGVPVDRAQARTYFLRAAEQRANTEAAIGAYKSLGDMYSDEAQLDWDAGQAKEYYTQAVNLADRRRTVSAVTLLAHYRLGGMYKDEQNGPEGYAQARIHYERAIAYAERFSHIANLARIELADMVFMALSGLAATGVSWQEALELCQAIVADDQEEEISLKVHALITIGRICYYTGNYQQAAAFLNQAIQRREQEDLYTGMANFLLGEIYFYGRGLQQNYALARQHFEHVLASPYMQTMRAAVEQYLNQIGR